MAEAKVDYKKEYKDLYMPKAEPCLIDVPEICFIMVDGKGNPNEEGGEYKQAVELLYGLAYTIKMSKLGPNRPSGYFEYVVPPLEGLWWLNDNKDMDFTAKEKYCWTSMIRQPEFVTAELFEWACGELEAKKPGLNAEKARLQVFKEGLCVQMMHKGPFDTEPESNAKIESFIRDKALNNAISDVQENGMIRRHHEIYLGDPRKIKPQKIKTVLRHPVKY